MALPASLDWKGGQRYIPVEEDNRFRYSGSRPSRFGPGLQHLARGMVGWKGMPSNGRKQWLI
jgi:hypothetical protein